MDPEQLTEIKKRNPNGISKMNTTERLDSFIERFFYNVEQNQKDIMIESIKQDSLYAILKMFEERFTLLENRISNLEKGVK